jgi:hypothetical protein
MFLIAASLALGTGKNHLNKFSFQFLFDFSIPDLLHPESILIRDHFHPNPSIFVGNGLSQCSANAAPSLQSLIRLSQIGSDSRPIVLDQHQTERHC